VLPGIQKVQHALIQSVTRQGLHSVFCCLMRLREWGYVGEFLCCHGMSWRVQDFSVVKLPCPGIQEKENPMCQSVRRPWDLGHAFEDGAMWKVWSSYPQQYRNWLELFVMNRCFYASLYGFSRCLCSASSLAVGVSPRLCEPYAFHFAKLHNRKRYSSGECIVRKDGEPLRWSPKFRDTIVHCCFLLLVCPSVRSASFPDYAVISVRCAGCRLSDKTKWPMDIILPFLCCQRKPNLIVYKPQLCTR